MQMMTDTSCVHRVADDAFAPTPTVLATVIFPPPIVFARGFLVRAGYADLTENKLALVRATIRRSPILRSHADHKQPWLFAALAQRGLAGPASQYRPTGFRIFVHQSQRPGADRSMHRSRSTSGFAIFSRSGFRQVSQKALIIRDGGSAQLFNA